MDENFKELAAPDDDDHSNDDPNIERFGRKLPRGKMFSATYQPDGARKGAGMWKKKKGRQLLEMLLALPFDGGDVPIDPKNPNSLHIPNPIKRRASEYFQMPEAMITVEMIMSMKQIAVAIQKDDTAAFNSIWEKAYGKPKELVEEKEVPIPVININVIAASSDIPEIKTKEDEDTKVDMPDRTTGDSNIP